MNFQDRPDDPDTRLRIPHDIDEVRAELKRRVERVQGLVKGPIPHEIAQEMTMCDYLSDVLLFGNVGGASNPTIQLPGEWRFTDILAITGMPDYVEPSSDRAWAQIRARYDRRKNADLPTSLGRGGGRIR